jgi:two-component system, NarL family, nitrate/nitrite response regulator NarL
MGVRPHTKALLVSDLASLGCAPPGPSLWGQIDVTRVLVVADTRLFRDGLADTLRRSRVEVAGAAAAGEEALDCVRSLRPDVVLLDMARLGSADTLRALTAVVPTVKVVAVAIPETERHVIACAEAGIAGYVPHDGSISDLMATLDAVALGETLCSPRMAASLFRRVASLAAEREPETDARLTAREREIVELIADGLSNKQIAERLYVEVATVKNHVHNILKKLNVRRRGEAAARLRRRTHTLTGHSTERTRN